MEDNWAMKKVQSKWNDLAPSAKPGSPGKQYWENSHNSPFLIFMLLFGAGDLFGSFYRSASSAFLFVMVVEFIYFFLFAKRVILVVLLSLFLFTSQSLAPLGFMPFQDGKVVFPRGWRLWGQKCFSAGKRPEKVVICGMMLVQSGKSTLWQLWKGKRKMVKCTFSQCLGERSPLLSSQDSNHFLKKNCDWSAWVVCLPMWWEQLREVC